MKLSISSRLGLSRRTTPEREHHFSTFHHNKEHIFTTNHDGRTINTFPNRIPPQHYRQLRSHQHHSIFNTFLRLLSAMPSSRYCQSIQLHTSIRSQPHHTEYNPLHPHRSIARFPFNTHTLDNPKPNTPVSHRRFYASTYLRSTPPKGGMHQSSTYGCTTHLQL